MLNDLHQFYGIDLERAKYRRRRSWEWLRTRITGLLTEPRSRLARELTRRDKNGAGPR